MPTETEQWFTVAIDQGTTSSRCLIFDQSGEPVAKHQTEFEQIYPQSGWIEHDPYVLLDSVTTCLEGAAKDFAKAGYSKSCIKALGITNQRETTIVWDQRTGEALHHAIVWCDARTTAVVHSLKAKQGCEMLHDLCGLPLSTYPSAVKLVWLLSNIKKVKDVYEEGYLAFGTVDSWLIYNLTGGKDNGGIHVSDVTNASRTMLLNIQSLEYDDKLIQFFNLERLILPKLAPSSDPESYGKIHSGAFKGIAITGCLGDQSAAMVGQCAFSPGMAKNTYGTGCFLLYNTGERPVISKNGLLTTVGYSFKGRRPVYALEGSIAVAGSAIKFLKNNLGIISDVDEVGTLATKVKDSGGVIFVTAFSGLFAPYWIDDARGTLFGITNYTKKEHICRATIEAACYQTKAILLAMEKDSGTVLKKLAVDGGMSNSDSCMQLQADIIGIEVDRPQMRETTALGAAIAAGFAVGAWAEFEELREVNSKDRTVFQSSIKEKTREKNFLRWERAVEKSRGWMLPEDSSDEE